MDIYLNVLSMLIFFLKSLEKIKNNYYLVWQKLKFIYVNHIVK